jgi:hypothetical protein
VLTTVGLILGAIWSGTTRSNVPISDGSSDEWWQRLSGGVDGF